MTTITAPALSNEEIGKRLRETVHGLIFSKAAEISSKDIRDTLMRTVADQRNKIIMGLLGVDTHWGEVRLYETNGHVTQLQEWIMEVLKDDLETFVKDAARQAFDDEKDTIKKKIRQAIIKKVKDHSNSYNTRQVLEGVVVEHLKFKAQELLPGIISEILNPNGDYMEPATT